MKRLKLFNLILGAGLILAGSAPAAAPPSVGEMARPFTLPDLEDRPASLSSFKGRVVFLHFWATWCPACREEMVILEEAARAHPDKLVILGINLGEKQSVVRAYVKEAGLTFPILRDARGKVAASYDVLSLPITLVVSPEGRIVDSVVMGSLDREDVERILARHSPD
jgi:thiol-disulfide isomerase/thioredoxin